MRIVTDFKDYYDGVCRSDGDHRTTFVRKTATHYVTYPFQDNFVRNFWDGEAAIFFADKWYPFMTIEGKWNPPRYDGDPKAGREPDRHIFDVDTACQGIKSKWGADSIRAFFRSFETPNESLTKIAEQYGPICVVRRLKYPTGEYDPYRTLVVEQNPKLEPLGFASVLPPQMAYMSLYKYLCNRGGDKPIPEMSNDTKIQLAGFDLKESFRKPKSGKRNRK